MRIPFLVLSLILLCGFASCEPKPRTIGEKVKDGINDGLDRRPGEKVRDAAEDTKDAMKYAAKDVKGAVKDATR